MSDLLLLINLTIQEKADAVLLQVKNGFELNQDLSVLSDFICN